MSLGMVASHFVAHLCVFGCLAYAFVPEQHGRKLDDKAVKCIFVTVQKVKAIICIITAV